MSFSEFRFVFEFDADVFNLEIAPADNAEQKICRADECGDVFGGGKIVNVKRRSDLFQSSTIQNGDSVGLKAKNSSASI